MHISARSARCSAFLMLVVLTAGLLWPQEMSKLERERAQVMLRVVGEEVRRHYYDPKLHGVDWDAAIADARTKIDEAKSFNIALAHIAGVLDTLNDSHTVLIPPMRPYRHEFGLEYQMVGERCFITRVRPNSDAEKKGVKQGDEILSINGHVPTRDTLRKVRYAFTLLRPQPQLHLSLKDPSGAQREVDVSAKIRQTNRLVDLTAEGDLEIWKMIREGEADEDLYKANTVELGEEVMVLKVPEFFFTPLQIGGILAKARKHKGLVVDLRGNPGGSLETLRHLVGDMFREEVKIGDMVERKKTEVERAKPYSDPFTGTVVVLVDSESASAAELFARIIQLEKRGVVLGDQTSGMVMASKYYSQKMGADDLVIYGISITVGDLIMSDGKSLEHTGVIPDKVLLPSGKAIAEGRDPVLAYAVQLLGGKLTAEEAGKLFPYRWPKE